MPYTWIAFVTQEPRATAAATAATTTHQTAETTHKMGQKTLLKRSAVPINDNNESRNVFLILPSYAERHRAKIKEIISQEKAKLCCNKNTTTTFSVI